MCYENSLTTEKVNPLAPFTSQLIGAMEQIKDAYSKAGLTLPKDGVKLDVVTAEMMQQAKPPRKCVLVWYVVCTPDRSFCMAFPVWDCTGGRPLPPGPVHRVTCTYGGVEYSEGAIITNGGVKQECRYSQRADLTEGIWVVIQ